MPVSVEIWIAFCLASMLAIAIPGPTMLLAIGNTLGSGPRIGFASLLGIGAADAAGMTVSVLGLSALLATVALAFEMVKWLGAAYLIWLGIQLWRAPVMGLDAKPEQRRFNRTGGAMLVGAGLFTATLKRQS